jgi:Sec-independent protein translocase protein TatA
MPDILLVLIIILIAVLVLRGPKTLPKLGEAFGRGVKEARIEAAKAQAEIQARTASDTPAADTPDAPTTTDKPA